MSSGARGVEASRALAASAYRSLIRAVLGPRARSDGYSRAVGRAGRIAILPTVPTVLTAAHIDARAGRSPRPRARAGWRRRRRPDARQRAVPSSRFHRPMPRRRHIFNRAHADPSGVEARHARAAVGYLDGAAAAAAVEKRAASRPRFAPTASEATSRARWTTPSSAIAPPPSVSSRFIPSSVDVERARAS